MKRKKWYITILYVFLIILVCLFSACDPSGDDGDGGDGEETTAPAAPDSLSATVSETDVAVDLSWQDNSDNESGFVLERKLNTEGEGGFVQILGNLDPDTFTICDDDADLEGGRAYEYRVKAFNDYGDSGYSNWAYAYIPPAGGSTEQVMMGFVYVAYADTNDALWYTWEDNSDPTNYYARFEVTDAAGPASGHQSGSDISVDFDPASGFVYIGYVDADGKLWYTMEDTNNSSNYYARFAVSDAAGPTTGQQSGTAISVDYDPESGCIFVGYVDAAGDLWYTWEDTVTPTNYYARVAVSDAAGPATGHQSGSDISIDYDPDSGCVYVGYVDTAGELWYTWEDTVTPTNYYARVAVSDAAGPTTGQQSGTAVSVDYDPESGCIYVGYVDTANDLWYTWEDTLTPTNYFARVAVSDAAGPTTGQQSGIDISVDFDSSTGMIYVGYVAAADGKLWYTPEDTVTPTNYYARYEVSDAAGPATGQQSGTAVGIAF